MCWARKASRAFSAVIASEAKQSSFLRYDKKAGLLRRFAPRNDGENFPILAPNCKILPGMAG
jgi:hypothetical protein